MTAASIEREKKTKNHLKTIMVVERDIVRKLIIPRDKNRKLTTLLSESQFDQIKKNSRLISEPQDVNEEGETEKILQQEEQRIEALKQEIEELKNEEISEIEEEEQRKKQHILARMEELKREQEDEVKQCNSLILSIKCKAIQDAQVAEKELIKRQLKSYEQAEDARMEEDRKNAMDIIKKKREEEWVRKQQYAQSILEQIQLNEQKRLNDMNMIQKEYKMMKIKSEKLKEEEKQNTEKKHSLHLELKKQNQRFNQQIKQSREQQREQEKLESLKVQEYLKTKINEERELETQRRKKKQMQERELARLWMLQKTSRTLSQTKDEIIAERAHEQIQRKWRQKELEIVQKKLEQARELRDTRLRQISDKRKYQTSEVYQKKDEAEKIKNDISKLKEELELTRLKQKQVIEKHKDALRQQIIEKERKKKYQREQISQEGEDLQKRMQKREKIIKDVIRKKIDQIKSANIPEIYVRKLEAHLKAD